MEVHASFCALRQEINNQELKQTNTNIMKKYMYFLIGASIVMTSCTKTLEQKAEALVHDRVKSFLILPDSYDPVETTVDSAFTPFDDPVFYTKCAKWAENANRISEYQKEAKDAKDDMSIWSDSYSRLGINRHNEAKEKYEEASSKLQKAEELADNMLLEIYAYMCKEKEFIGFKAKHRYRASSNSGIVSFGAMEFLIDKDMTKIIEQYDMDSDEYKAVQYIYDFVKEGFKTMGEKASQQGKDEQSMNLP